MDFYTQEIEHIIESDKLFSEDNISNKVIMISGATGMIGTCLINLLMLYNNLHHKNISIIALSRDEQHAKSRFQSYWNHPNFRYVSCDVNQGISDFGSVDYIIHAASNSHPVLYAADPIGTILTNVIGTRNLLDYAVKHKVKRFCFISSVEIYGENRGDIEKFDENYLGYLNCDTLRAGYPESKRLGETLCNAYYHQYGLEFVIPRLSRVYGPTMLATDSKATAQFIKKAVGGEDIVLKSDGAQLYSYTFVTDAVMGILYVLLLGKSGEAYNIADEDSDITLKQLADMIAQIAGKKVVFELPDEEERKGYSTETKALLDATKLCRLGWTSRVHWQSGLKCMLGKGNV